MLCYVSKFVGVLCHVSKFVGLRWVGLWVGLPYPTQRAALIEICRRWLANHLCRILSNPRKKKDLPAGASLIVKSAMPTSFLLINIFLKVLVINEFRPFASPFPASTDKGIIAVVAFYDGSLYFRIPFHIRKACRWQN